MSATIKPAGYVCPKCGRHAAANDWHYSHDEYTCGGVRDALFTRDDLVQIAYEAFAVANYPQVDFNEAEALVAEMLDEVEE